MTCLKQKVGTTNVYQLVRMYCTWRNSTISDLRTQTNDVDPGKTHWFYFIYFRLLQHYAKESIIWKRNILGSFQGVGGINMRSRTLWYQLIPSHLGYCVRPDLLLLETQSLPLVKILQKVDISYFSSLEKTAELVAHGRGRVMISKWERCLDSRLIHRPEKKDARKEHYFWILSTNPSVECQVCFSGVLHNW